MGERVGIEVSLAAAEAVKMANVDVVAAYPIPLRHISWNIYQNWWPMESWMPNSFPWSPNILP